MSDAAITPEERATAWQKVLYSRELLAIYHQTGRVRVAVPNPPSPVTWLAEDVLPEMSEVRVVEFIKGERR